MKWIDPIEVVEEINSNIQLASTEEIKDVFLQESKNAYSFREGTFELILKKIQLDYGITRVPNEPKMYMSIPLWDFYGVMISNGEDDRDVLGEDYLRSFITISALDSSRFNRIIGY